MAKLHRQAQPGWDLFQEVGQPYQIIGLVRRQLHQQYSQPGSQSLQSGGDPGQPALRLVEPRLARLFGSPRYFTGKSLVGWPKPLLSPRYLKQIPMRGQYICKLPLLLM